MAYSSRKNLKTEHPSKTIVKTVRNGKETGSWPRIFLLSGKEDFLVNWSLGFLKEAVISPVSESLDYTRFSASSATADDIIAACEAYPLMSVRRLVAVSDCDFLSSGGKGMDAASVNELTEYIPKLPESTILVLTARTADKRKAIYKAIEKTGIVYDFVPLDDETLAGWMAKRLSGFAKTASRSDLIRFAQRNGYGDDGSEYNLYNLENDLKKAAALCPGETLRYEDLCLASPAADDTDAFRLLDSAFSGKKGEAFSILHNTIDAQTPSKVQGVILSFLGLLCSQLEIMLEARERTDEGKDLRAVQAAMGTNEYRLRKAMEASRGRSAADLKKSLLEAYRIEELMRSGEMDPYLAMELFIAGL